MFRRFFFPVLLCLSLHGSLYAHGNGWTHVKEMYSVLPFASDGEGWATPENKIIQGWLKMITSSLIDNYKGQPCQEFNGMSFYEYLHAEFGFGCKHRLLFHWGFNSRPWTDELERKISRYSWYSDPDSVAGFKKALVTEQARRNRMANASTERVFGFSSSGRESAWANGMLAVMYDVHLLGDWEPECNSDFDGVVPPSRIVGDIINALRRIDPVLSVPLQKKLKSISGTAPDENTMSLLLVAELQKSFPDFLLNACNGELKKKFEARGYTFKRK